MSSGVTSDGELSPKVHTPLGELRAWSLAGRLRGPLDTASLPVAFAVVVSSPPHCSPQRSTSTDSAAGKRALRHLCHARHVFPAKISTRKRKTGVIRDGRRRGRAGRPGPDRPPEQETSTNVGRHRWRGRRCCGTRCSLLKCVRPRRRACITPRDSTA